METGREGIQLLYLDPDDSSRERTTRRIERVGAGLEVVAASSLSDGLAHLEEHGADCVLGDAALLDTAGLEELRACDPDLPVLLAANSHVDDLPEQLVSAATDVWRDGSSRSAYELLVARIRDAVQRRRGPSDESKPDQGREHVLEALHDVATEIGTSETIDDVCQMTVDAAAAILDFDKCVINVEEDGYLPVRATSSGLPPEGATTMSVGEGIAGKTYRTGESFLIDDLTTVEAANPQGPYQSAISIPIGDAGVFQTVSRRPDFFSETDLELAELLVSHTAAAIERIRREQELRDRERELARQNDRLEKFASIVSHDLRNPLNVATGRLERARSECDSDQLEHVAEALTRIDELLDNVAVLTAPDRSVEFAPVALDTVIQHAWRTIETEAATLRLPDQLGTVECDESHLCQLFENLFRNAVEHGSTSPRSEAHEDAVEHAGPDVTVTVGALPDGFYVEDDGPGLPDEQVKGLFEWGSSAADNGTGLGLAIVEQIVEAHEWDVTATNGARGARFEITTG